MGIGRGSAKLLIKEASLRPFSGSVLQLGRQEMYFSIADLNHWADEQNVSLSTTVPTRPNGSGNTIDDVSFFNYLGFESVLSADFSDFEDADFVFDLNLPVSEDLHGKFDMIFDGGTVEHCFNIPQVFQNIFSMLKIGGRIIHGAASSNWLDHGFYMFSPTLFWDHYNTNHWQVNTSNLIAIKKDPEQDPWLIFEYTAGCIDQGRGFYRGHLISIWFIAEKVVSSTGNIIPQQGVYVKEWVKTNSEEGRRKSLHQSRLRKIIMLIKRGIRKNSLLFAIAKFIAYPYLRHKYLQTHKMPKIIEKY